MHIRVSILRRPATAIAAVAAVALFGCASVDNELEQVAKDWCLTIRASQVIPVYPLTEDLQPGDVFLVTVPVQAQAEVYEDRGFLPLDLLVTRLHDLDYATYYRDAYWKGDFATIPHRRLVRTVPELEPGEETGETTTGERPQPAAGDPPAAAGGVAAAFDLAGDLGAPRAAFPTYTFHVARESGARLAIPVKGVPIALGFMGATSATGTVTISDAYTYAAPAERLTEKLREWAQKPAVKAMLAQLESGNPNDDLFLRVVQRVYLTGSVVVSLANDRAAGFAGEADLAVLGQKAGAAGRPATPAADPEAAEPQPEPSGQQPASTSAVPAGMRLEDVNQALDEALAHKTPGAAIRFLQASSRSVSLKEQFDRPLVIGYLGFDFPIGRDGHLGVPIATLNQLEQRGDDAVRPLLANDQSYYESKIHEIFERYLALARSDDEQDRQATKDWVTRAGSLLKDEGIGDIARRVAAGELPAEAAVQALRSRTNLYLATQEAEGVGPVHAFVLSALEHADQRR